MEYITKRDLRGFVFNPDLYHLIGDVKTKIVAVLPPRGNQRHYHMITESNKVIKTRSISCVSIRGTVKLRVWERHNEKGENSFWTIIDKEK